MENLTLEQKNYMNISRAKVLIVVPAYNEAGAIARTVKEILFQSLNVQVCVVDDGSKDATADQARAAKAMVLTLPFNLGIGGAVQTGFQFAAINNFDIVVQVDGDGQHDASYLPPLIQPLLDSQADMVIGSRFLTLDDGYRSSFWRRMGIRYFSRLIGLLTGAHVTDPTSGFRACNRKLIQTFAEYYPQDFPEPEAIVVARRMSAVVKEVPVRMRERSAGLSSIRRMKSFYYMIKVTCAILLHMMRKQRKPQEYVH